MTERAQYEFHKDWKLSGIRQIFYNDLIAELGGFGSEPGRFIWPTSVALTPDGDLVIQDSGNERLQFFSQDGHHKHGFSYGSVPMKGVGNVAATKEGLLLVTDGTKAIKVFSKEGKMIHQLSSPKTDWKHSYGIAVLPSDNIAVTDWTDGGKIHIIGVDWRNKAILKTNVIDGLHRPVNIAVNMNEEFLVTEGQLFGQFEGRCLKVIDSKGTLKRKIGPNYENKLNLVNPSGVCVDSDGNIFLADEGKNCIAMFNPDASLTALVVTQELEGPCGISMTREGLLAVADCYHHKVKIYRYKQDLL